MFQTMYCNFAVGPSAYFAWKERPSISVQSRLDRAAFGALKRNDGDSCHLETARRLVASTKTADVFLNLPKKCGDAQSRMCKRVKLGIGKSEQIFAAIPSCPVTTYRTQRESKKHAAKMVCEKIDPNRKHQGDNKIIHFLTLVCFS